MSNVLRSLLGAVLLLGTLITATPSLSAPLPEAKPEDVGMSSERLERLAATMQRAVDSGELPGVVVMIARKGKLIYQKSFGMQDKSKAVPMSVDSIFRAYSMTKPNN